MKIAIILACIVATALAAPGKNNSWRIIGGEDARPGQFPHQVSLHYDLDTIFGCAGSILDETTILTAGHCAISPSAMHVHVGNNKLSAQTDEYLVKSIVRHEDYDPEKFKNDIAILKLSSPIKFSDSVQPIALRQSNVGEEEVIFSGWGTTSYPGDYPDDLQFIHLKTISVEDCQARQPIAVGDTEVCTLTRAGEGTCHGDSGSPLIDGKGEQIGIASWVIPCGVGYPDVFTRVYSFLDWIEDNRH